MNLWEDVRGANFAEVMERGAKDFLDLCTPTAWHPLDIPLSCLTVRIPREIRKRQAIPARLRREVLSRDGSRCVVCGDDGVLHIDHIYPVSRGGKTAAYNLQTLCQRCNLDKGGRVYP